MTWAHTTPRGTGKHDTIRRQVLQLILDDFETISLKPGDLVCDAVDLGVVFGALQDSGVLLDGVDTLPSTGQRESDGVATRASECIY